MTDPYLCVQEEEKRHKEHVERVMVRLRQEKDAWFLCRSVRYKNVEIRSTSEFHEYHVAVRRNLGEIKANVALTTSRQRNTDPGATFS